MFKPKDKIMIYYMDKSNKVTQRIIRIMEIKDTHIIAYCYYRKQVRSFNINNILSSEPIRKRVGA